MVCLQRFCVFRITIKCIKNSSCLRPGAPVGDEARCWASSSGGWQLLYADWGDWGGGGELCQTHPQPGYSGEFIGLCLSPQNPSHYWTSQSCPSLICFCFWCHSVKCHIWVQFILSSATLTEARNCHISDECFVKSRLIAICLCVCISIKDFLKYLYSFFICLIFTIF